MKMAIEQKFTDLPNASSASDTDIICAVQGYVDPGNPGISVQMTLAQIQTLIQRNLILSNSGNPNGAVAGSTHQLCWDTVNNILWVCTTSGTIMTAVWTKSIELTAGSGITIVQNGDIIEISANSASANFVSIAGTSQAMVANTTYQPNNGGLVTLTLPATAIPGDRISIAGFGAGGWTLSQAASQQIIVGNVSSTAGVTGAVSSTNRYDGIDLCCVVADTTWQTISAPQGSLNIV